jgi:kynurenine formamidase
MIVAQRIDTALHVGTHFDGAMHATDNRKGDMASLPLDYLVKRGVSRLIDGRLGRLSRAPANHVIRDRSR